MAGMAVVNVVKPNRYQDSVTLMQIAVQLRELEGIEDAALMMGTQPNRELLHEAGLLTPEGRSAGPNDLIVALRGTEEAVQKASDQVEQMLIGMGARSRLLFALRGASGQVEQVLKGGETAGTGGERAGYTGYAGYPQRPPHTLPGGLAAFAQANLALISVPGIYAAAEARKALKQGLHVMLFSDNVAVEDEVALKRLAAERGLLMMGPDCGTAIIGGVPLGFANVVRRGSVGVVGASGTGMQEVTALVHRYGAGISHAIGTGSRDLSAPVGGLMTLAAMKALLDDPATSVLVVVSKPPHPDVARRVVEAASNAAKPVVLAFPGMEVEGLLPAEARSTSTPVLARTLEEAALRAVELAGIGVPSDPGARERDRALEEIAVREASRLAPTQKYVRGLFSGGTFCYETMLILRQALGPVYSNTPLMPQWALPRPAHTRGRHACLDLGSDEFTLGRPHPMIDMSLRVRHILEEAADPEVAVLLLDVVLGYGAHPDPARELAPAIATATERAASGGRHLAVVAHVCGTEHDPQGLERQERALTEAGAVLAPGNASAARLAAYIATQCT
jgi:succinyl-CoA synthetase alpha subunit